MTEIEEGLEVCFQSTGESPRGGGKEAPTFGVQSESEEGVGGEGVRVVGTTFVHLTVANSS